MTFFQIKTYSLLFQLSLGHKRLIFTFKNQKKKKIKRPVKIPIFGFRHIICHKRCFVSQHFLFLYLWISIDHHPDITGYIKTFVEHCFIFLILRLPI